jgi:type 1 fimbriae regulatory protein FimE
MSKRKFLTWREVSHMMQAVSGGQTGARDCCLILLAFRHGLRISELLGLRFRDLDLQGGRIIVSRLKQGFSTVHPLMPDERRALEAWMRVRRPGRSRSCRKSCLSPLVERRCRASRRGALSAIAASVAG